MTEYVSTSSGEGGGEGEEVRGGKEGRGQEGKGRRAEGRGGGQRGGEEGRGEGRRMAVLSGTVHVVCCPTPAPSLSCVKYVQEPMNSRLLETALDLHMVFEAYPQALLVAMQLNRADLIRKVFVTCQDE